MIVWVLCLLPFSGGDAEREIVFHSTIAEARASEQPPPEGERRPLVITFHAPWCSWCRKMEVDTFRAPEVTALADKFLWVRIDVDEHPGVAARFDVTGLPDSLVLNGRDEVIASQAGYMPPDVFASFLHEALENLQPPRALLNDLLARWSEDGSESERRETLTRIVEHLAGPDRQGRAEALEALAKAGPEIWTMLLDLMAHERLAIRAAAGGALSRASRADLPFDPFADSASRERQIQQWREWMTAGPLKVAPE